MESAWRSPTPADKPAPVQDEDTLRITESWTPAPAPENLQVEVPSSPEFARHLLEEPTGRIAQTERAFSPGQVKEIDETTRKDIRFLVSPTLRPWESPRPELPGIKVKHGTVS